MANRTGLQVRVLGLDELQKLERTLDGSGRRFADRLAQGIADEFASVSPDDGGHRLASSWQGRAISDSLAVVESNHPGAKARDRGAYLTPKHGKAIRFQSSTGQTVFARFVRQKGTHYVDRALRKRRVIAEAVFEQEFANLRARS
jgi:hypothetical protein